MPKAQHAAMAQQDVVAQANDDRNAHLAQDGVTQTVGKYQRRNRHNQREKRPHHKPPDIQGLEFIKLF
jgi:hypothetical protein